MKPNGSNEPFSPTTSNAPATSGNTIANRNGAVTNSKTPGVDPTVKEGRQHKNAGYQMHSPFSHPWEQRSSGVASWAMVSPSRRVRYTHLASGVPGRWQRGVVTWT